MHSIVRALAFSSIVLLLSPLAPAQAVATLNCTDEGGGPPITAPIFAFNINTDRADSVLNATVYLDISLFPTLLAQESSFYTNCTISSGGSSISMQDASFLDVSASGIGPGLQTATGQIYASTIFTFDQLTVGGVVFSSKGPATAAARASALAAIKARGFVILKGIGEK